jgi:hypothetical protein
VSVKTLGIIYVICSFILFIVDAANLTSWLSNGEHFDPFVSVMLLVFSPFMFLMGALLWIRDKDQS